MKKEKTVKVNIELNKDVLFYLFMEAHKKDITLNALVNKLLKDYIDELETAEKLKNKKQAKSKTMDTKNVQNIGDSNG